MHTSYCNQWSQVRTWPSYLCFWCLLHVPHCNMLKGSTVSAGQKKEKKMKPYRKISLAWSSFWKIQRALSIQTQWIIEKKGKQEADVAMVSSQVCVGGELRVSPVSEIKQRDEQEPHRPLRQEGKVERRSFTAASFDRVSYCWDTEREDQRTELLGLRYWCLVNNKLLQSFKWNKTSENERYAQGNGTSDQHTPLFFSQSQSQNWDFGQPSMTHPPTFNNAKQASDAVFLSQTYFSPVRDELIQKTSRKLFKTCLKMHKNARKSVQIDWVEPAGWHGAYSSPWSSWQNKEINKIKITRN